MAAKSDQENANGAPPPDLPGMVRFSTDALPANDRAAIFREVVGQYMLRLDFEPLPGQATRVQGTARALPGGLFAVWYSSTPYRMGRTPQLLSDGDDSFLFQWANAARFGNHLGREVALGPGDGALFSMSDAGTAIAPSAFEMTTLKLPRKALAGLLRDADDCLARPVPGNSAALRLLLGYLDLLREESSAPTLELQRLASDHACDLLAIALGATRDAAECARRRGVGAARLAAIKKSVRENLEDGDLSVADLAASHRVTPRYVQKLFESEGTTFREFLRDERLALAHRMLGSLRFADQRIAEIVFACGFNDISYFNRSFRARYGASPSDIRNRGR
jgi:AraC-like DNA-binding protein